MSDWQSNGLILCFTFIIQKACINASPTWKIQWNFHGISPWDYIDISISTNNKIYNLYAAGATLHMLLLILLSLLFIFFLILYTENKSHFHCESKKNSSDNKNTSVLIKNHNPVMIVLCLLMTLYFYSLYSVCFGNSDIDWTLCHSEPPFPFLQTKPMTIWIHS